MESRRILTFVHCTVWSMDATNMVHVRVGVLVVILFAT